MRASCSPAIGNPRLVLVRLGAVVVVRVFVVVLVSVLFQHRDDAAVCDLALGGFELDGGVGDAEAFAQHLVHRVEDRSAGRRRNIGNRDVA